MLVVALGTLATAVRRIAMLVVAAVGTVATVVRRIAMLVVALGSVGDGGPQDRDCRLARHPARPRLRRG